MVQNLKQFEEKYKLSVDGMDIPIEKNIDFLTDLYELIENICNFFLKMISSGEFSKIGQILLCAAYLEKKNNMPPIQKHIANCMGIRDDRLTQLFTQLENRNFIKRKTIGTNKHIIINLEENPKLKLISEIGQKYWKSKKDEIQKIEDWMRV